jgi:hypothetical protein
VAFDQSSPRWLGISDLIAEPEGPTFISYKVARCRLDRLRFVTQDPNRKWSVHRSSRGHSRDQSLDHLVGGGEQRRRHGEAERFRGLKINDQLELGR